MVLLVMLLGSVTACSFTNGAPQSESAWRSKVDQALGAATSSLGSAALLLDNEDNGHLTRSFVVVAMRDALATLETEASKFVTLQPRPAQQAANRQVVAALGTARAVLSAATIVATRGGAHARSDALRRVRRTNANVQNLTEKLAG
jgi:hypothetical protein